MSKMLTLSTNDKRIDEAMRQAQANLDIEGLSVPAEGDELILKVFRGEISQADFVKAAAEIAKRG